LAKRVNHDAASYETLCIAFSLRVTYMGNILITLVSVKVCFTFYVKYHKLISIILIQLLSINLGIILNYNSSSTYF